MCRVLFLLSSEKGDYNHFDDDKQTPPSYVGNSYRPSSNRCTYWIVAPVCKLLHVTSFFLYVCVFF